MSDLWFQFINGFNADWRFVFTNHLEDPYRPMVLVGAATKMFVAYPLTLIYGLISLVFLLRD